MKRRVLYVFDTTGSMSSWIRQVRNEIAKLGSQLLGEDPECEVGFIAYGDYCDGRDMLQDSTVALYAYDGHLPDGSHWNPAYTSRTRDVERWLANNRDTGGGDTPEAIEYVMRWISTVHAPAAQREGCPLMVLWVCDAPPHELGYNNPHTLDWRVELRNLTAAGTPLYTALCGEDRTARAVLSEMSSSTGGVSVDLRNIANLGTTMIAVVKREAGDLQEYADRMRGEGVDPEMEEILVDLGATCYDAPHHK